MEEGLASAVVTDRLAEEAGADEDFGGGVGQWEVILRELRLWLNPSALPGISPSRGEIGERHAPPRPETFNVVESSPQVDLPP
ncbi:protein of unknown function [Agrobacterium pusense]|uniref:Uncharacterized protein n=1 Tax=Agrobacterium pusense TaxID=648995 RepID=U4PQX9_9HYPH|nr:protein of unknown function [Agrobacterium pusense]